MNKVALLSLSGALLIAIAGCDDSSSGGSSGGIDENQPEKRTSARSGMSLDPSSDSGELSQMFAGGINGQLPGGNEADDFSMLTGTIEARNSQPSNNAEAFLTEFITQVELLNDRRQRNLSARNDEPDLGDMFESFCETGSASYSQTDSSVSLSFNNCRTDMGEEGEMRISGSFSVSASDGNLDNVIDDTCTDESVSATMVADDFWFRMYDGSGDLVESAFISADVTFSGDENCATNTTTTSVDGPYFFVDVNGDWFGFYDFDFSVALNETDASNALVTGIIDFTFDSSELDGSLTVKTTEEFAAYEQDQYPHAGELILSSGDHELVYTFNDFNDPGTSDDEAVVLTGRSNTETVCTGQSSWAQMNNGQASCN